MKSQMTINKSINQAAKTLKGQAAALEGMKSIGSLSLIEHQLLQAFNSDAFLHIAEAAKLLGLPWAQTAPDPPASSDRFYPDLPFNAPLPPEYKIPTEASCHVVIDDYKTNVIAGLYTSHVNKGKDLPFIVGVKGDGGKVWPGGQYSASNDYSIPLEDVEIEIVGLTDDAEVGVGWSTKYGNCKSIKLFNIGLRGDSDSFVIRANEPVGTVIMDGCWFLNGTRSSGGEMFHTSGLHIDNYETLVIANHRNMTGIRFHEHSFYLKSCVGIGPDAGTWIVGCNLTGGNRTGFQRRPQQFRDDDIFVKSNAWPRGPFVVAYNYSHDFGWEHDDKSGGSVITIWTAPDDDVFIFHNTILNARYGCLVLSGQPPHKDFLNTNGYPIRRAHVYANKLENSAGDRGCVSFTGVEDLHLWEDNGFVGDSGDLTLGNPWAMEADAIDNGKITIHGRATLDYLLTKNVRTYNPDDWGKYIQMPDEQLSAYLVPL